MRFQNAKHVEKLTNWLIRILFRRCLSDNRININNDNILFCSGIICEKSQNRETETGFEL